MYKTNFLVGCNYHDVYPQKHEHTSYFDSGLFGSFILK